jgi:peptidoglycan DL-endopeptidase LytE
MRERYRSVVFFALIVLLFVSIAGFAKNNTAPSKSSINQKKAKLNTQRASNPNPTGVYKVSRGDTLYEIARRFKTTPETLKATNKLSSSKIRIGQQLRVPAVGHTAIKKETPQAESPADPNQTIMTAGIPLHENKDKASNDDTKSMPNRLVEAGFQLIGVKYRFSGLSEKSGLDCSGLVKTLFSKFDIELPRCSRDQYKQGEKIDRENLEVGDLVFFSSGGKTPTHVGIYVGNDKFIHAARKAKQVIVSDLSKVWYSMRYLGARRIMELWWEEPDATSEKE